MATATEIRNKALVELGIIRPGQDPQAQDAAAVDALYSEVYGRLKEAGLATWASTGEVPDELVPHVRDLVALEGAAAVYGISDARYARIVTRAGTDGVMAERNIRRLITPQYESADDPVDF